MKIYLTQIKTNGKFYGKNPGFAYSGFVKTCDKLVTGSTDEEDTEEEIKEEIKYEEIKSEIKAEEKSDKVKAQVSIIGPTYLCHTISTKVD
jgi:hypothetical protein